MSIAGTAGTVVVVSAVAEAAPAARPAASVAAPKAAVSSPRLPRAYQSRGGITLRWHNPATGLKRVVVRVAKGGAAPTSPRAGRSVPVVAPRVHAVLVKGLARNTRYSASVFALDRRGRASAPAVVRFTTAASTSAARQPGTLTGVVQDTTGAPLVNAQVFAYNDSTGPAATTARTDTTGTYTLDVSAGSWVVAVDGSDATGGVSSTGYVADYTNLVTVRAARTTRVPTLRLRPGGEVRGHVQDAAGHGIDDAFIAPVSVEPYVYSDFSSYEFFYSLGRNQTPGGNWTLRGVDPDAAFRVCAGAEAGRVDGGMPAAYALTCSRRSTLVTAGKVTTVPDLTLTKARGGSGDITGVLRRPDGRPIAGVVVAETNDDDIGDVGYAVADAKGRYTMSGISPGTYIVCGAAAGYAQRASFTGYVQGCSSKVRVTRGGTAHASPRLRRGAAAGGTVRDASGRPVAGVQVNLSGREGEDAGGSATTDSAGQWVAKGLRQTRYTACYDGTQVLRPATGTLPGCWAHGKRFPVFTATRRTGIDSGVRTAGALSGVVSDAAGRPLANAGVTAFAGSEDSDDPADVDTFALTDAQGRYTLRGLTKGSYVVCAFGVDDDVCSRRVVVRTGATTRVPLRTAVGSSVTVSVRDAQDRPVAGVDAVALARCGSDDEDFCSRATTLPGGPLVDIADSVATDGSGTAHLTGLAPGTYAVCLYAYYGTTTAGPPATGYADSCAGSGFGVVVRRGQDTPVAATLGLGGAVSGTVRDASGKGLADVPVAVSGSAADDIPDADSQDPDGDPTSSDPRNDSVTAADGTFTVLGVRPGQQTVCARPYSDSKYLAQCLDGTPGKATGGSRVTVTAEQTTPVTLTLTAGAALAGRVKVAGRYGGGKAGIGVFAGRRPQLVGYTTPGAGGRWGLGGLPAGSYTVCAAGETARCWRNVVWSSPDVPPPLGKATLITVALGQTRTGIDFSLPK